MSKEDPGDPPLELTVVDKLQLEIYNMHLESDRMGGRIDELEAQVKRSVRNWMMSSDRSDRYSDRLEELRGLIAECLALNPTVSGSMEKVRVWADVVRRMKEAAHE